MDAVRFEFDTDAFDVSIKEEKSGVFDARIFTQRQYRGSSATAIYIHCRPSERGLEVTISEQEWAEIAASLGTTIFATILNPINLLGRINHLATDVQNLSLGERVENFIRTYSTRVASQSQDAFDRSVCKYCRTRNEPIGPHCISCGAPL